MKKAAKPKISQKKLNKTILSLISFLMMGTTAWFSKPLWDSSLPVVGETPVLISNQTGDDLQKVYISAIEKAQQSILFMIFGLTDDKVIQALRKKSENGVLVKVICDAKASPYIVEKLGPQVDLTRRFSKGHMHLKILLIDDKQCWIGSANMTGESLKMHGNLVIALDNSQLAALLKEKATTLKEYDRFGDVMHQSFSMNGQEMELSFLPDDRKGSQRIKELIRSAKKTIRVAMFTWTREDLAKELISAKKRGVRVEVVLDHSSAKGSSAKIADLLKKEGVGITCSTPGPALLHHKWMWIDDKILEAGSANWTKAAFSQNDDCFLILHELNDEQNSHLKKLWRAIQQDSVSL